MPSQEKKQPISAWKKIDSIAKLLGGIAAVLGSVLIPFFLHKSAEDNRKAQVYAQVMSQREAKDTEIRAQMFDTLLSRYLETSRNAQGIPSSHDEDEYDVQKLRENVVFLNILMNNFQEYFNAKPLFEDLYRQISEAHSTSLETGKNDTAEDLKDIRNRLLKVAKSTASRQITLLSRVGLVSDEIAIKEKCEGGALIPLFATSERQRQEMTNFLQLPANSKNCEWNEGEEDDKEKDEQILLTPPDKGESEEEYSYAISIKAHEIAYPEVKVEVMLYEPNNNREYQPSSEPDATENPYFDPVFGAGPFVFSVSFFDMPYMDNTRLFEGDRFALILKDICIDDPKRKYMKSDSCDEKSFPYAVFQVVTFKEEFMSLRDRPLFDQMIQNINGE